MREQLGREPIVPPGERLHLRMKRFVGHVLELVAPRAARERSKRGSGTGRVVRRNQSWQSYPFISPGFQSSLGLHACAFATRTSVEVVRGGQTSLSGG